MDSGFKSVFLLSKKIFFKTMEGACLDWLQWNIGGKNRIDCAVI
jgi:hypothetical protein